jgi:uncharacterized protein YukE
MGYGDLVQQAVDAAADDMGNVQAAADAISAAISKASPWMNSQTWQGPAAANWQAEWQGFYRTVQNCLGELPSAESSVISETQTQMEQIVAKHDHQSA